MADAATETLPAASATPLVEARVPFELVLNCTTAPGTTSPIAFLMVKVTVLGALVVAVSVSLAAETSGAPI